MVNVFDDLKSNPDRCADGEPATWELGLFGKPRTKVTVVYFIMADTDVWFVAADGSRARTIRKDFTVQGRTQCDCDYTMTGSFQGIVGVRAKVLTNSGEQDTSVGGVRFN